MSIEIPTCGICHVESAYMRYTYIKGCSKTYMCSQACFDKYRELAEACRKYQMEARKISEYKERKANDYTLPFLDLLEKKK